MASHNHRLQPAAYLDRMGMPGGDMSNYIRRYASYLNEKRESYKLMGYDFCKIKRGFVFESIFTTKQIDMLFLSILEKTTESFEQCQRKKSKDQKRNLILEFYL